MPVGLSLNYSADALCVVCEACCFLGCLSGLVEASISLFSCLLVRWDKKASWLPVECRSTGVFLIRRKTGSHYLASVLSSLLIVRDGNRGYTESHCSGWMRHASVCHEKKAITLPISHVMEATGHNTFVSSDLSGLLVPPLHTLVQKSM